MVAVGVQLHAGIGEGLPQVLYGQGLQPGTEGGVGRGFVKDIALGHRADIEAGAPHQKGEVPPGQNAVNGGVGLGLEAGHRVLLPGVNHVQKVVGDAGHLLGSHFPGAKVQTTVDLPGVGGDHLAVIALGQCDAKATFAAGGGA